MDILLEDLEKDIWIRLLNGSIKPKSPYQYFTVSSFSSGGIRLRTVVLRKTSILDHQIYFYTDIRSQKWKDWNENPKAHALFYDRFSKIQIVLEGDLELIPSGKVWENCWNSVSLKSRKAYMTELAPGTPIPHKATGLLEDFEESDPGLEKSDQYRKNFGVILLKVKSMEYLQLNRSGNYRARISYSPDNSFQASWLTP